MLSSLPTIYERFNMPFKKLSQEEVIERFKEVHGDRYDYSKVIYIDSDTKVEIICKDHGSFWQLPYKHIIKQGCPKCYLRKFSNNKNKSKEHKIRNKTIEFINKSQFIWKDKYDYSEVVYNGIYKKVKIICKEHGNFEQIPKNHLKKQEGCYNCYVKNVSSNNVDFIKKAQNIFGNLYDYSKVEYINNRKKIKIICKKHGEFEQMPITHLQGKGCSKCFKDKCQELFNNVKDKNKVLYDYSQTVYVNSKLKVNIICLKCKKDFWQTPDAHIRGQGCPKCNSSKGEKIINDFLNEWNIIFETQKRFKGCRNKYELRFDFYIPSLNLCIEYDGLQHFKDDKTNRFCKRYEYVVLRDSIKNKYCLDNNIKLIRIPYWLKENEIIILLIKTILINN